MKTNEFDPVTEIKHKRMTMDWTVNISNLITLAGLLITVVVGWNTMDKRVLVLEEAKIAQVRRDESQDTALIERLRDIKDAIKDVKDGVNELRRDQAQAVRSKP